MVYLFGTIGFLGGFALGLGIINMFLRAYNGRELVENKQLRWTYGLAVWLFAGLGAWAGVQIYHQHYF
jgi:hypothetical protein